MKIFDLKYVGCLVFLQLTILLAGCSGTQNAQPETKNTAKQITVRKKPGTVSADTLRVYGNAAVFYQPDTVQLEKIKRITDSMVFNSMVHENFYLMRNARIVLHKYYPQIKITEATASRFLLFTIADKKTVCIDLNERNDAYGLFISDGTQKPKQVDMNNIDTELGFYYQKSKNNTY